MYCSNCGQELNTDAKFCSRCGAKIQNSTLNERQDKKHEQASVLCPKCKLDDRIEKVTSIVKSQTRTREQTEWVTDYYTDKNGKEQSYSYPRSYNVVESTDLAKRLSPPQKPQLKSFSSCAVIVGGGLLFYSILVLAAGIERNDWSQIAEVLPILVPLVLLGLIVFVAKSNHDRNERERVAREMLLWEGAVKKWNRLYYCYRDDVVFDGDNIESTCQPEDTIKFCYQQAARTSIFSSKSTNERQNLSLTEEEFAKLTFRQQFAVKEFGYLLSPEDAETVGKMLSKFRDKEARKFSQERGTKVT